MKLDMTPILNKRLSALDFDFELIPSEVEDACEISEEYTLLGPVRVSGRIVDIEGFMKLQADVFCEYETFCDRCLDKIESSVNFSFERTIALSRNAVCDEDGEDIIWIKEGKIDFDADAIEELSLELPIYHLCSEDCPGLCSVCGKKHDGDCGLSPKKELDHRLEIFKKLLDKNENK